MRLDCCKSTQHIKHTTAFFAFVLFMYPVGTVIYKGFFNPCHLFINGSVKWVGKFNVKGNDRMRAGRIK